MGKPARTNFFFFSLRQNRNLAAHWLQQPHAPDSDATLDFEAFSL